MTSSYHDPMARRDGSTSIPIRLAERAFDEARFASDALSAHPDAFEEGESTIRRGHIELSLADGNIDEAQAATTTAWTRIEKRASKILDAALRETFVTRVPHHQRIRALRPAT